MRSLPFLLAHRFLRSLAQEQAISRLAIICFASISLGSCALLVTTAIVHGFRRATQETFQNVHPDITIQAFTRAPLAYKKISAVLEKEFKSSCAAQTPYSEGYALAQSDACDDLSHLVTIQGIDPQKDGLVRKLNATLKTQLKSAAAALKDDCVLVGDILAKGLGLAPGETLTLLRPTHANVRSKTIAFEEVTVTVGGVFKTGLDDMDGSLVICPLSLFNRLFPQSGITNIGIKLHPDIPLKPTIQKLSKRFNLDVFSWQELYPALEAALALEDLALMLIVALVALITNLNVASLLSLFLFQKRLPIAILRTMGMQQHILSRGFMIIGATLVIGAQLLGLAMAAGTCFILEHFKLISLPSDAYFASYVPAELHLFSTLWVLGIGITVGLLVSWIAARQARNVDLATTLKMG
ncbi:TPA: hypothetical protein DDZ86_03915 [Candidatus Dependentiae bacterium]|nr:MAG: Lipoprotein releasing system, transmembrane protein, LolC/E family [candidate division TM6 bacterium GW2011_GWF2_43_87]HBL98763.1 hypothetical protein [Candidatus Dependentiae bacterium]